MNMLTGRMDAYLDRIGLTAPVAADLDGLTAVHDAQLRAIPFENFDVLLGRGVDVSPDGMFAHLVTARRGGYCFTLNALLRDALQQIGFADARTLFGRVLLGPPGEVPPRLHALVTATVAGQRYVLDAGFGAHTPRVPIPLADGAEITAVGRTWRLARDPEHGWRLRDRTSAGWRDLYVFDELPVHPSDVHVGNWWISTCPLSPFVTNALIVRHTDAGRVTLLNRTFSRYEGTKRQSRELADAQDLACVIGDEFRLPLKLTDAERDALWKKLAGPSMPVEW